MPCVNFSEVKIVDDYTDVQDVIKDIIRSENREEAFHVFNVGDVLAKHKLWLCKIPRVEPHYGKIFYVNWIDLPFNSGNLYTKSFQNFSQEPFLWINNSVYTERLAFTTFPNYVPI